MFSKGEYDRRGISLKVNVELEKGREKRWLTINESELRHHLIDGWKLIAKERARSECQFKIGGKYASLLNLIN